MTQIRPLTQPLIRRPGELGVHSLDHFNFSVPDAEDARRFGQDKVLLVHPNDLRSRSADE